MMRIQLPLFLLMLFLSCSLVSTTEGEQIKPLAPAIITSGPHTAPPRSIVEPSAGIELVRVPGGCFQKSDLKNGNGMNIVQACVDSFYMGRYEITQRQWQRVMGNQPAFFTACGDDCPVESVGWNDVQTFLSRLNGTQGTAYRLASDVEWDYACRGGGKQEVYCGGNNVDEVAWYDRNSSSRPHPVGQKQPNSLGIHDMSGNVWEWVHDRIRDDSNKKAPANTTGASQTSERRIIRGGSWYNDSNNVRASAHSSDAAEHHSINLGFRIVCSGP